MTIILSDGLRRKLERRAVEEAVANFLKERDESTYDHERDDDERKASASCIVTLVAKVAAHQNKEDGQ